jgi:hypothetical protein
MYRTPLLVGLQVVLVPLDAGLEVGGVLLGVLAGLLDVALVELRDVALQEAGDLAVEAALGVELQELLRPVDQVAEVGIGELPGAGQGLQLLAVELRPAVGRPAVEGGQQREGLVAVRGLGERAEERPDGGELLLGPVVGQEGSGLQLLPGLVVEAAVEGRLDLEDRGTRCGASSFRRSRSSRMRCGVEVPRSAWSWADWTVHSSRFRRACRASWGQNSGCDGCQARKVSQRRQDRRRG